MRYYRGSGSDGRITMTDRHNSPFFNNQLAHLRILRRMRPEGAVIDNNLTCLADPIEPVDGYLRLIRQMDVCLQCGPVHAY